VCRPFEVVKAEPTGFVVYSESRKKMVGVILPEDEVGDIEFMLSLAYRHGFKEGFAEGKDSV